MKAAKDWSTGLDTGDSLFFQVIFAFNFDIMCTSCLFTQNENWSDEKVVVK